MPYNPGRYFAPRYWADNYFDTEIDAGGGNLTATLLGTSALVGTMSDVQPALGSLSHLAPNHSFWPVQRKLRKEVVFVHAIIRGRSAVDARGHTRYHTPRYAVIEELIRKYEAEVTEDDEEVLMLMV